MKYIVLWGLVSVAIWVAVAESTARLVYSAYDRKNSAAERSAKHLQKWNTELEAVIERAIQDLEAPRG